MDQIPSFDVAEFNQMSKSERTILRKTQIYTKASTKRGLWQILTAFGALVLTLVLMLNLGAYWAWTLIPLLALVLVRIFILEHDCGHRSLFSSSAWNDSFGRTLAAITGVAYQGWRIEHNWHHQSIGSIERRWVDRTNSPMTTEEALKYPDKAKIFINKINPFSICILGTYSLLFERKQRKAFFVFRPNFRWKNVHAELITHDLWINNFVHLLFHGLLVYTLGLTIYLSAIVPSMLVAAMVGSSLFWLQHNFEHSYLEHENKWSFVAAALQGSSYLKLPGILQWFTGDIGLHHVHHLNPRIPNYRLKEAMLGIDELAQIKPLSLDDVKRCYTHLFWDSSLGKKVQLRLTDLVPSSPSQPM